MSREAPRVVVCLYCRVAVEHNDDHADRCAVPCKGTFRHPVVRPKALSAVIDTMCVLSGQYNITHSDVGTETT